MKEQFLRYRIEEVHNHHIYVGSIVKRLSQVMYKLDKLGLARMVFAETVLFVG